MRTASKREHELNQIEARRQAAFQANDIEAFAAAVAEMAALAEGPDVFTCIDCGQDFEGDHVELLVAAVEIIEDKEVAFEIDCGVGEVFKNVRLGRHIKFCKTCADSWAIDIRTYMGMR